ncbi:unnamed protein product [Rangifer tarandus platyrhynchus]|uniref:Uncharacterized protein n=1 Tax=Rangifer tarandus platyrhynchus TaxID=3082113 RepID=A0AC60A676_RANTA
MRSLSQPPSGGGGDLEGDPLRRKSHQLLTEATENASPRNGHDQQEMLDLKHSTFHSLLRGLCVVKTHSVASALRSSSVASVKPTPEIRNPGIPKATPPVTLGGALPPLLLASRAAFPSSDPVLCSRIRGKRGPEEKQKEPEEKADSSLSSELLTLSAPSCLN